MPIGLLTMQIHLPGCTSLKEKRSRIKPLLARLQREFNISVAEMDYNDTWQSSTIGCALLSNDSAHLQRNLARVIRWVEKHHPDIELVDERIEII